MSEKLLVDILGWIGAVALLGAYGLVSMKKWPGDSLRYQSLNVLGAILLIINSAYYGAIPSVAVNMIWVSIALVSMLVNRWKVRKLP